MATKQQIAKLRRIQKYMKKLHQAVATSAKALDHIKYDKFPDEFQDTEVEAAVADIEALRAVLYRFADSIIWASELEDENSVQN